MTFFQALIYFVREAALNLLRSWKVSLVAVLTIAVSLFVTGVFLLVGGNLRTVVERWQGEGKIVIYLEPEAGDGSLERLREKIEEAPWAAVATAIPASAAHDRFRQTFPTMADLLDGWGENPLPASLEVRPDWDVLERDPEILEGWLDELRADPDVSMADDDRDWLSQLRAVVFVIEGLGLILGSILLLTAVFTISSVIRLTAYLYRDEIAVMRLVGATEFFIRGPFYMEGLLQGFAGGLLAVFALVAAFAALVERHSATVLASFLASDFLSVSTLLALIGFGALAGLAGAVASLRKESLGHASELPEWLSE